ncbi:3,4-dihydroxy-2-butanone 4-phosphate synthase, partial [Tolypocladium paradoxum]
CPSAPSTPESRRPSRLREVCHPAITAWRGPSTGNLLYYRCQGSAPPRIAHPSTHLRTKTTRRDRVTSMRPQTNTTACIPRYRHTDVAHTPHARSMPSSTIPQGLFDSIPDSIEAFRNGEFLVVLDDPGRENEADLIIAAQDVTTEQMAWMVRYSSGFICAPIKPARADALALPLMVSASQDPRGTAYTLSVDANHASVTTGISAHDRALACRVLADPAATPDSLRRPG